MKHGTGTLGFWAWLALFAVSVSVLSTNTTRFLPPSGDRFVDVLSPGATDLIPSFNAAAALLHGENPYRPKSAAAYRDPYAYTRGEHEHISYLYPPTHALIYTPIVWLARHDFRAAARIHLVVSLGCLFLLAWAAIDLVSPMVSLDEPTRRSLLLLLPFLFGLNPGSMLGFERGQSDLITAAFCWCGLAAWRRQRWAIAAFLVVAGTLLKGYGIVLAIGVLALGLRSGRRRDTISGAIAALVLLLLPVARYLPDALAAYRIRSAMFWPFWYNQGFSNLLYVLGLPYEGLARATLVFVALSATALAWLQLRRLSNVDRQRELWIAGFGTASLSAVLGYSLNSLAYDCVIVAPGALVLALGQRSYLARYSDRVGHALGFLLALICAGLFTYDLGRTLAYWQPPQRLPLAAAAELGLLLLIGGLASRELVAAGALSRIWIYLGVAGVLTAMTLVAIQAGVEGSMRSSDLALDKAWRASSTAMDCNRESRNCGGGKDAVFVHTNEEKEPWIEFDLGIEQTIAVIEVQNREDCCQEKAVPLVLEVSDDRIHWRQVARRDGRFDRWRARFRPLKTRYVRARVTRQSTLHLERVSVWAN